MRNGLERRRIQEEKIQQNYFSTQYGKDILLQNRTSAMSYIPNAHTYFSCI